jgi:hypothetical protein
MLRAKRTERSAEISKACRSCRDVSSTRGANVIRTLFRKAVTYVCNLFAELVAREFRAAAAESDLERHLRMLKRAEELDREGRPELATRFQQVAQEIASSALAAPAPSSPAPALPAAAPPPVAAPAALNGDAPPKRKPGPGRGRAAEPFPGADH